MHKVKAIGLIVGFAACAAIVFVGSLRLAEYFGNSKADANIVTCKTALIKHQMVIQNSRMNPDRITATACDTLRITNLDYRERLISFGHYNNHKAYDGVTQRALKQGESFTVSLHEIGRYTVHDHEQDEVEGTFTVKK